MTATLNGGILGVIYNESSGHYEAEIDANVRNSVVVFTASHKGIQSSATTTFDIENSAPDISKIQGRKERNTVTLDVTVTDIDGDAILGVNAVVEGIEKPCKPVGDKYVCEFDGVAADEGSCKISARDGREGGRSEKTKQACFRSTDVPTLVVAPADSSAALGQKDVTIFEISVINSKYNYDVSIGADSNIPADWISLECVDKCEMRDDTNRKKVRFFSSTDTATAKVKLSEASRAGNYHVNFVAEPFEVVVKAGPPPIELTATGNLNIYAEALPEFGAVQIVVGLMSALLAVALLKI